VLLHYLVKCRSRSFANLTESDAGEETQYHQQQHQQWRQLWCVVAGGHDSRQQLRARKLPSIEGRGRTDRVLTLICHLLFQSFAKRGTDPHTHAKDLARSVGSKDRVEQTDGRTDGRKRLHYVPCLKQWRSRTRSLAPWQTYIYHTTSCVYWQLGPIRIGYRYNVLQYRYYVADVMSCI